uniref:Uncharacterized protein n=1 Tax=Picea sitchensis TaxID=3332 RepID=D5A8A9_PICSI|nr:unknown [Picea sitchensis]
MTSHLLGKFTDWRAEFVSLGVNFISTGLCELGGCNNFWKHISSERGQVYLQGDHIP